MSSHHHQHRAHFDENKIEILFIWLFAWRVSRIFMIGVHFVALSCLWIARFLSRRTLCTSYKVESAKLQEVIVYAKHSSSSSVALKFIAQQAALSPLSPFATWTWISPLSHSPVSNIYFEWIHHKYPNKAIGSELFENRQLETNSTRSLLFYFREIEDASVAMISRDWKYPQQK